jgi:rhodanese-related sulfurtransferase
MVPEMAWSTVQGWRGLVLVIDARNTAAFARQHIPGALPLSEKHWEEQLMAMIKAWRPGAKVVVYCDNEACRTSQSVARRLRRALDSNDVFVLKGGWSAWLEAQRPGK